MPLGPQAIAALWVEPGAAAALAERSTTLVPQAAEGEGLGVQQLAREDLATYVDELARVQRPPWADGRRFLLVTLQAMDVASKDRAIPHAVTGVNRQGCGVAWFEVHTPGPSTRPVATASGHRPHRRDRGHRDGGSGASRLCHQLRAARPTDPPTSGDGAR